jgi:hypothetical protein
MSISPEIPNPFLDRVVSDAWSKPADVPSIHAEPFRLCLSGLASVQRGVRDSLLVAGSPGSGKTHLLTRLQRHLTDTAAQSPDGALQCVFVAVKLQANPYLLWQHVRRRLADDLMRREQGVTQLQRLVAHKIASERREPPKAWVKRLRVLTQAEDEIVSEYLEAVTQRLDIGREVHVIIEHLVRDRALTDARAALRGESLPEAALERLGLGPTSEDDDREEVARRVVTSLCRLAGDTLPVVFCFDQVEALTAAGVSETEAFARFGRVAADLVESDENVFLISCVQTGYLASLEQAVRKADRDRAFQRRTSLEALTREQVHALVRSRLDASAELASARAERAGNPFYPFEPAFVDKLCALSPMPRKVFVKCAERFEELQVGGVRRRPEALEPALERFFDERKRAAVKVGPDLNAEEVLMHGLPILWHVRGVGATSVERIAGAKDVSLALPLREGRLTVHVCNERHMNSLAARLKRIVKEPKGGPAAVVRGPYLPPITKTAKKVHAHLHEFEQAGGRFLYSLPEVVAALDALRSLVSEALAGDLSHEGQAVDEGAVRAWLARHLDGDLAEFVERLESPAPPDAGAGELMRDVDGALASQWVAPADAIAREIGRPVEAVVGAARLAPERVGVLEGPPAVLFVRLPPEAADEPN